MEPIRLVPPASPHRRTTEDTRDDWRTPPRVASPIIERFRFSGDAAADAVNALAPCWIDEQTDALKSSWQPLGRRVWMNPPYSKTHEFMRRARLESESGRIVVCLVPATTDVKWFRLEVMPHAQEIWFYAGRISFISPQTGLAVAGNPVGSMLVVFNGPQSYAGARIGMLCSKTGLPISSKDGQFWRRTKTIQQDLFT